MNTYHFYFLVIFVARFDSFDIFFFFYVTDLLNHHYRTASRCTTTTTSALLTFCLPKAGLWAAQKKT